MNAIIGLLLFVTLYQMKFAGWQDCHSNYLALENARAMKGLFAVIIILHHLCQQLDAHDILGYFRSVGFWGVSIFFFYSGYGLMTSVLSKKDYLQTFWVKRLPKVIIPFMGINAIYLIVHSLLDARSYTTSEIICYLTGIKLINGNGWYIIVLLLFYVAFYLLFKFLKPMTATISMALVTLGYIAGCYYLSKDTWLYNSCPAFFIGMVWSINRQRILAIFSKNFFIKWGIALLLFYLAYLSDKQLQDPSQLHLFLAQTALSMLFVICIISAQIKFKFANPILLFLGTISMEIYLIQHLILDLLRSNLITITNNATYVLCCLLGSILAATLLHYLFSKILAAWAKITW